MSNSGEEFENVKHISSKIMKKYLAWLKSSVFEETFKMLLASKISKDGDFAFSSDDIKNISKFVASGKDYLEENNCDWMNRFRMLTKDQQYAVVRHQQFSYFLKMAKKPTLTCRNFEYKNYKAKIHHKDKSCHLHFALFCQV
ncbi:hypothetical protein HELRODRAFT_168435 [Helobdella robusta]|uniref:Uncharacterized protein n=1 Tax=Helobdella robusta TaxID=6412 RepID=T1F0L4_HELRO|nr:hypothetical protein HELRODRAFT_168435 [Helobdella robusta]ESO09451.1 hypothetical protein HELRODRAFT_168435 [Helobdella robusta]